MNNFKIQLDDLQSKLEQKKLEKARLEERLKNLEEEHTKLFSQLKELNISNPEDLKVEIGKLEKEIEKELNEISEFLK